jgi:hypothetical protein
MAFVVVAGFEIATEGRKSRCRDMVGDVEDRNGRGERLVT